MMFGNVRSWGGERKEKYGIASRGLSRHLVGSGIGGKCESKLGRRAKEKYGIASRGLSRYFVSSGIRGKCEAKSGRGAKGKV